MTHIWRVRRAVLPAVLAIVLTALAAAFDGGAVGALGCPRGYHQANREERQVSLTAFSARIEQNDAWCINDKHPEGLEDLEALEAQRAAIRYAPDGVVTAGSFSAAVRQKATLLAAGQDPANAHRWQQVGQGPLQAGDTDYGVSALGNVELAGRITSFAHIPATDRFLPKTLLASVSEGGVWMADEQASNWVSIGEGLPTQVVGAVGYTPAGGGTILALTGDGSFGANSREGAGAFYTLNLGRTWRRASGVPDDAFGFRIAVDNKHPNIVYAATGAGLFRSTNGGVSYVNAGLPTGACKGKSLLVRGCLLANTVTDVVVMTPGGFTNETGGKVLATVGWRGGNAINPDGTVQSPNNGLYESATGAPGTFTKIEAVGFTPQDRIGRIEIGAAEGPAQDHNYVYALVQDAVLIRDGLPGIDAPEATETCQEASATVGPDPVLGVPVPCQIPSILNGVYVSPDFGHTWTKMADPLELANPATGTALIAFAALASYGPGVQSWYNMWIRPDPTLADPVAGIPTRLLFGLEEVWENEDITVPQVGHSAFKVIGRYFSGSTCQALGQLHPLQPPYCPTNREQSLTPTTTTHPDQHDAVFIPISTGGVRVVVGNDGGVHTQVAPLAGDFSNARWGIGANRGFNTLLPYDAVRSKDGTVWMGLQDNGTAKIVDVKRNGRVVQRGRQVMTFGGDGFFVAVHPDNANIAYGETPGGTMRATSDGGRTWNGMNPPITHGQFSNPFVMDPRDPNHLMTAGNEVVETGAGPGTSDTDWKKVYDLGTAHHRGSASAEESDTDAANAMTALDLRGPAAYVGFCGTCDILNDARPFVNGIATNVGGSKPPKRGSSQGWHIAHALGLPNRYITGIAIDPADNETVYVSLGGYFRRWTPPGSLDQRKNTRIGSGHLFVSHDAGEHFTDISANLPNIPVNWITLRGRQVIAATDIGVFASALDADCSRESTCSYQVLGRGLPTAPVFTVRVAHGDPNLLVAATFGRGVYSYRFGPAPPPEPPKPVIRGPKFLGKLIAGTFGFETSDEGWVAETTSDLESWERQAPGYNSSQSFQVVPYTNEAQASLVSPKFAVPARSTVRVSWFERIHTEDGFDYFTLEWSTNRKSWKSARSVSGQNRSWPNFDAASATFVAPAGPLYLRFRLSSDQLISFPPYEGVAIDDVKVER